MAGSPARVDDEDADGRGQEATTAAPATMAMRTRASERGLRHSPAVRSSAPSTPAVCGVRAVVQGSMLQRRLRRDAQCEEERRLHRYLQIEYGPDRLLLMPAPSPSMRPVLPLPALPALVTSADMPPENASASEGASLSDEDSRMADADGGAKGADSGERDARGGRYSEYGTRSDEALLGLGMVPPTRPSDGTPRQPVTPPSEESLDDKDPRHVDIDVGAKMATTGEGARADTTNIERGLLRRCSDGTRCPR